MAGLRGLAALACLVWVVTVYAYPIYDSGLTGIRRLEEARLAQAGVIAGQKRLAGELLTLEQVDLRLLEHRDLLLPPVDPAFTKQITGLLDGDQDRYSIAVLDLSDIQRPRYAEHNADVLQNPGSVGKIVVGTAVFQALADAYPEDLEARREVLGKTWVTADEFIVHDSHEVRFWSPQARRMTRRPIRLGDQASLWEFLDWSFSPSSNAAASTVIKQTMLLVRFGRQYPVADEASRDFFMHTPRAELAQLLATTLHTALARNGVDLKRFRQGSFFTAGGKRKVPGTSSYATTRELMRYLLRLEQGRIVDEFSSRELKRLLYVTERRIRYASSPALYNAAVYFKSGSLYQCQPEPGFICRKFHGNKRNLMNSVAIVEAPAGDRRLYYFVTLTSNVLRKNSAVDHQTLATGIHRLIEAAHH